MTCGQLPERQAREPDLDDFRPVPTEPSFPWLRVLAWTLIAFFIGAGLCALFGVHS